MIAKLLSGKPVISLNKTLSQYDARSSIRKLTAQQNFDHPFALSSGDGLLKQKSEGNNYVEMYVIGSAINVYDKQSHSL